MPTGSGLTVGGGGTLIFDQFGRRVAHDGPGNDSLAASPAAEVTAVPEPGTLALLTVAVCGTAVYHRLRSRRKQR